MATQYIDLTGTCNWCKKDKPDAKYDHYSVDLYPDEESWGTYHDAGLQLKIRTNEETEEKYIQLRRPHKKLIKDQLVTFGPPNVVDADNKPFDGLIGNGSKVKVKVAVYDTVKGVGSRWEGVQIIDLVEYEPEDQDLSALGIPVPF